MKNKDFFLISAGSKFFVLRLWRQLVWRGKAMKPSNAVYVREGFTCMGYNHENLSQGLCVLWHFL